MSKRVLPAMVERGAGRVLITSSGSPKNKAQTAASRVLPETTRAAMHAAQTRPREGEGEEPG